MIFFSILTGLLEIVPEGVVIFLLMIPIFICREPSANTTCTTGLTALSENFCFSYFFDENEVVVIVNSYRYVNMFKIFFSFG